MAIIQAGVDEEEVEILMAEVDAVEAEDMYVLAYHLNFLIYMMRNNLAREVP